MISVALQGFIIGLGLIVAIGAQNVFVLKAGLTRNHVFVVAGISALCDTVLIILGAGGLGTLIASIEILRVGAKYGGALFVFGFRLWSLYQAWRAQPGAYDAADEKAKGHYGLTAAVTASFAFALLNPHVYVDTVLLLGGIAGQYTNDVRPIFVFGACVASFTWFYGIGYGARFLLPLFQKPATQRIFDLFVAAVMFLVAAKLLFGT